ncbi:MAG: signal recognition particle protein [Synergistaceae bacterium]|nr:signal recognition particle protein [Candidatus Equadaptatus faecalis]
MFDTIKERFGSIFSALGSKGKLSQQDIDDAAREIRRALLEADVNFKVVKQLTEAIKQRAEGQEIVNSVTPSQQIFTIVYEELVKIMGEESAPLKISPKPPTVYLMAGLQGSGKTTSTVKIAKRLQSKGHKCLAVACDLRRPAAVEQLRVTAERAKVAFYGPENGETNPVSVAKKALGYAEDHLCDVILVDTAGRLQLDEELMQELEEIKAAVSPTEILLVADSMTGQEAVNVASAFNDKLSLTGVVLTKLDGDARGGPSLAIRSATGVPIKLAGCGEKTEDLELFDAKRMAQRILGMGDLQGLLEKVQSSTNLNDMQKLTENVMSNRFTLNDMLAQLQQIQKLGPLDKIIEMLPVPGAAKALQNADVDGKRLKHLEAVILSMTPEERSNPAVIKGSRRRRIAEGSGTTVQQVNQLLAQYDQMKGMMKSFGGMSGKKMKQLASMMKFKNKFF